ncbi:hypothetical protein EDE08_10419 [Bradyrhizobium sp. R2.2-H]|jgi:hypothetical protein|uniref:hypothetical protein n=1 Tax=unclassified Bradyrhizobium TaxID=2631580 RepID=UPI001045682B|nr:MULTISPECIES: hypothetical protein [unclassified Bradyrhizobium]TCU73953.1 hypothetical protein EDE10_104623 [Bradyrhizobium sp. Y-H1]TCU75857.1 hypothetical protein EDE08_10419 [Bradyrhizobium sp. R2.2-H]
MSQINLGELTNNGEVRNLSGHERGVAARQKFALDNLDAAGAPVLVHVPEDVYSITSSFFQGMFAQSVRSCGDRERFLARYQFEAPVVVLRQIERGIEASLMKRGSILAA